MHLKNGFLASSRESLYIVQNNGFSLSWPNHANFSFLIAALCLFVCLFVTKLGCFDLYLAENNVFPFSFLNYAVFCFMAFETCFHSFAVKFCCFNVMAPKKGFLFSVARLYCLRRGRTGKKVFFLFAANHTNFFSSIIWSDTIEVCKLLHRVEWVQLMVIWVGCTLRVESFDKGPLRARGLIEWQSSLCEVVDHCLENFRCVCQKCTILSKEQLRDQLIDRLGCREEKTEIVVAWSSALVRSFVW